MKNVIFKIVNENLFNKLIIDVDASGLKNKGIDTKGKTLGFYGDLSIEKEGGNGCFTISGEFGINDYKDELGFILTPANS